MKMKMLCAAAALAASLVAGSANAASFFTTPGSAASFAAPAGNATINFNGALPAGFTLSGGPLVQLITGDTATSAEPAFSDGSRYLSVAAGGAATLANATVGYNTVSIFLGSIDAFNGVDLLDAVGNVIGSWEGWAFTTPANGDQEIPNTNRRITFARSEGDALISGIRIRSAFNSAEVDNVVFAVPESSTWAMMLLGFGLAGMAIRSRRRRAKVVFA
ncbi:PEPxxWA-CTERM sorting domain-containing protein [Sphingomonas sp. MG17]|jgi:hypothetical protein|uniref:PEPxxWA-CTERM sorting domain-containing protein n=1 Tax=Sphingomonas tagetis TaxID=2949092 RepID=A0A9X2KPK8_9SPHN|nr:PEPxxWA-CTERM sorting domain-containing protein [Sphingomonas tagetis]MCP3730828.1 PEPxxWA-CTERM sorting domain-containing protein [Sphingomonas tagetis]